MTPQELAEELVRWVGIRHPEWVCVVSLYHTTPEHFSVVVAGPKDTFTHAYAVGDESSTRGT
jgi:hypothetical protein